MLPSQLKSFNIVYFFPLADRKSFRSELNNVPGIYGLFRINPETGLMELYIGESITLYNRLKYHSTPNNWKGNSHLYNSLKKYGVSDFQVVIFVTLDPASDRF